ncbi:glycosyltransferase family 39 protein [Curtobacterium sp. DN_7.5]|uniref:ArnT family glycosyltransferase n=1 Tax=Curtobacterium sp. DN_7.5 TaxID=3049047 RepID=UPI001F5A7B84|nr:glycosyltransferase family 39 protein [Curtobacterium sp. DN_7.5]
MSTSDRTGTRPARWLHQTRRHQAVLVAVVVLGAVLTSWNLARGGDSEFYAAAARSMSESLPAFLSGSFDPSATVTLDKLAGFAVPQAISVHVFGMSTAALALPQVVEGAVTTLAVSVVGLRLAGARAGLVAAALAAATPIFVSMFGHPMEDGLLTMALAVALVWWQRSVLTGRSWPLLLAGLFVGIGFQAKMLQAWLVLPALVVGTVVALAVPGVRWRRALGHVAVLVASALVASLAWSVVVELLPAADHPYVDGSTDDSVFAMVFGYNGLDRFLPGIWPGAVSTIGGAFARAGSHLGHAFHGVGSGQHAGGRTLLQLFSPRYASQVGWSWPAALAGIGIGAARWWPGRTGREARPAFAALVAVVVWLVTATVVLSVMRLPHTAYVAGIGVQLALLGAVGWWGAAGMVGAADRRLRVVPVALLVVQGAWWTWLARSSSEPVALGAVAVGATIAALIALLVRWGGVSVRPHGRGRRTAAALLVASVVLGPACFSLQALDAARDGSGGDASVGVGTGAYAFGGRTPDRAFALARSGMLGADRSVVPSSAFHVSASDVWGGHSTLTPAERALVTTAERAGGGRDGAPLFMTDSWRVSADVIGDTGREVLTDGGFSGHVPVFTVAQVDRLVASGAERLFVLAPSASPTDPVVEATDALGCRTVRSWGAVPVGHPRSTNPFGDQAGSSFTLVRCR